MADEPDFSDITIRNPNTGETRTVAKHAHQFFPGWDRIDTQGRTVPATKKES